MRKPFLCVQAVVPVQSRQSPLEFRLVGAVCMEAHRWRVGSLTVRAGGIVVVEKGG